MCPALANAEAQTTRIDAKLTTCPSTINQAGVFDDDDLLLGPEHTARLSIPEMPYESLGIDHAATWLGLTSAAQHRSAIDIAGTVAML